MIFKWKDSDMESWKEKYNGKTGKIRHWGNKLKE